MGLNAVEVIEILVSFTAVTLLTFFLMLIMLWVQDFYRWATGRRESTLEEEGVCVHQATMHSYTTGTTRCIECGTITGQEYLD